MGTLTGDPRLPTPEQGRNPFSNGAAADGAKRLISVHAVATRVVLPGLECPAATMRRVVNPRHHGRPVRPEGAPAVCSPAGARAFVAEVTDIRV